jgi:hypothetical protein
MGDECVYMQSEITSVDPRVERSAMIRNAEKRLMTPNNDTGRRVHTKPTSSDTTNRYPSEHPSPDKATPTRG